MRNVETRESTFCIAEDEGYRLHFTRDGNDMELWKVTVKVETEVFILAESEKLAIDQAVCVNGIEKREEAQCSADRVPFGIRGWSRSQF